MHQIKKLLENLHNRELTMNLLKINLDLIKSYLRIN